MKHIPLTRGAFAIVDDCDYDSLAQKKWQLSAHGYAIGYRRKDGRDTTISMHRAILNAPAGHDVDHINGNPLDNRRHNLRVCSRRENIRNTRRLPRNTSGYKGVSLDRRRGTYRAMIKTEDKHVFLGRFPSPEEAALVYNEAAERYFGEFAYLNQVPGESLCEVR